MSEPEYCVYCQRTTDDIALATYDCGVASPNTIVCADKAMSWDLEVDVAECEFDEHDLAALLAAAEGIATDPNSSPTDADLAAVYIETLTERIQSRRK